MAKIKRMLVDMFFRVLVDRFLWVYVSRCGVYSNLVLYRLHSKCLMNVMEGNQIALDHVLRLVYQEKKKVKYV